jgi:hypothetical protein
MAAAQVKSILSLVGIVVLNSCFAPSTYAVVKFFDGFGDADRNNDGVVNFYDTDINLSGTWNDPTEDATLASRGIVEVTAATDPSDTGLIWLGTRSFDTAANLTKANLKIINDDVATGVETVNDIHNSGLALSVEPRGGGGSFIGRFPSSVDLGPVAGDKVVVSFDFRYWRESTNRIEFPSAFDTLRWGIYEDTDNEFGMTAPYGDGAVSAPPGATVEWGKDDGNWFSNQPGAEGDKGIYTQLEMGVDAFPSNARINWEYNVAGINGTTNNGRILEGTGVSNTPGSGGDVGTVATPASDGTGGIIHGSDLSPSTLSLEIVRLEDGLIQVATLVNGIEFLRDEIKTTDTGFDVLGPPAFSYDYIAFRNTADFDFVIDNVMVEIFGSNAEENTADFDGDGDVDGRDFLAWQRGSSPNPFSAGDLALWQAAYNGGALSAVSAVPEPSALCLALLGLSLFVKRGVGARN